MVPGNTAPRSLEGVIQLSSLFQGSYKCDGCKPGYIGTGESCSDENECTRQVCDEFENTDCFNTKGLVTAFVA